jgi:hypothetical protein
MELLNVVSNLPKRYALEIKIKSKGNYFRIMLDAGKSLVDNKPVVAVMATVPLDLAVRGCSDPALYDILAFTDWASDTIINSD